MNLLKQKAHKHILARDDQGNVLFIILIAVALFGALSYAVTQSGRGSTSSVREQESLYASQILQYASSIQQTVTRLKLSSNCTDTQINFNNAIDLNYVNPSAPGDGSCDVFSVGGGGMIFQKFPDGIGDAAGYPVFVGSNRFTNIGTAETELGIFIPIRSRTLCERINTELKLPLSLAIEAIAGSSLNTFKFKGTYVHNNTLWDNGGNAAGYAEKRTACMQAFADASWYPYSAGIDYFFYSVLIER